MKNLNHSKKDCLDFHKAVVSSKNVTKLDPTLKNRLLSLENDIELLYNNFKIKFDTNCLEKTVSNSFPENNKNDLLSLYNYKSKLIQELKLEITTTETNRIINTCQNCTLSEINSFDHILPKEEFSEFVVNPLNLFPSCTICNSYKGKIWNQNGNKIYLNLYLDNLPHLQYLFVDIEYEKNTFGLKFYLENKFGIEDRLFSLIESHYERLHLLKRFSDNGDKVISPLRNQIKPYLKLLDLNEIKSMSIETSNLNRTVFGFNYWESILELSLINNSDFINSL
ncbi:hypothetical protein [Chryseobacterium sp. Leaf394]|uniref:hypothetical protein n=1 Tax=Chryseobacterium sp. Leaf394 TaxID=1736361 RepID=UPI0006F3A3BA|nr:hypothetical protein [Chryseobacterium sp. Leaf394]KQS93144.1 hypothetical protein ASG21_12160 [Chryseobacterium sp. Leaf394]